MVELTDEALQSTCAPLAARDKHKEIIDLLGPVSLDTLKQNPALLYWYSLALLSEARFTEGANILGLLNDILPQQPDNLDHGRLYVLKALESVFSGESDTALHYAQQATSLLPASAYQEHFRAWATRAVLANHFGAEEESNEAFSQLLRLRQLLPVDQNWWFKFVVPNHADWLLKTGHMQESELLLHAQLNVSPPELNRILLLRLATIAIEQGSTSRADQLLSQTVAGSPDGEPHSYWSVEEFTVAIQILRRKGEHQAALNSLYDAIKSHQQMRSPAELHGPKLMLADIWIEQEQHMLASLWLDLYSPHLEIWPRNFGNLIPHLVQANLAIAETRWRDALELLELLQIQGEERGHSGMLIQIHARRAYAYARMGNQHEAILAAREAGRAGQNGNYAMSYIVEGVDTRNFLVLDSSDALAQQKQFTEEVRALSDRELEILELVREGLTNPEIGEHLYIARNTVKNHLANIYQRWGISSREEAVQTAEWLGLFVSESEGIAD